MPTTRVPTRRRLPHVRKRTIFAALVAMGLLAAAGCYLYLGAIASSQLREAMKEADRLDPKWRLLDLEEKREKVADAENSAIQIARATSLMPTSWPPVRKMLGAVHPSSVTYEEDILTRIGEVPPNERLNGPLEAELRRELAKISNAVTEARKLAEMRRGRFPIIFPQNVMMTLLPHLQTCRNLARVLQADAILRAQDGDIDGALDSCRALLSIARAIGDEPSTISQLVRVAIATVAMQTSQRVLAQGEASEAALAKFQADLVEESKHSIALAAMRGERAMTDDLFSKMATGELDLGAINGRPRSTLANAIPLSGAYYNYNHALTLEFLNRAVEIAKMPENQQADAFRAWQEEFTAPAGSAFYKSLGALSYLLVPSVANVGQAHLRNRAILASSIALVAAERHRLARGEIPASADLIGPRFRAGMLGDPYAGGPVRFRAAADRTTIYSVGPDRKDDGGKFDPRRRPVPGTDHGWTLWAPSARRRPTSNELPADVFQKIHPTDETAPIP